MRPEPANPLSLHSRIRLWYAVLLFIMTVFLVRLFYLQVIRYNHYRQAALSGQLKEYEIPAERGIIEAHDGNGVIPLVLNEKRYTLFADPKFVSDPKQAADEIERAIGGDETKYEEAIRKDTRYAVLAKKLTKEQKEKVDALKLKGIGTREESQRTYPQGQLAAQLLGFVNDDGEGKYGIEQYLDSELKGTPGQLRAITDAQGVPLVANKDNVIKEPLAGKRVTLTINLSMQKQAEDILKAGLDAAKSQSGSVLILDARNGAVRAMANYPTYNPAEFFKVEDAAVFNNAVVSAPLEVGSIMKPLTAAAALDLGVVNENTSYFDPGFVKVDGETITNVEEVSGAANRTVSDILRYSLNTGAVYLLKQMGGGEVNEKARVAWHDYMTKHYQLGKPTGIEQGYEASGSIPDPKEGFGLNIQFANTSFGQGMTATPLQMGAALVSVVNGGTYYRPYLVEAITDHTGKTEKRQPKVVRDKVVSPHTGELIRVYMERVAGANARGALRNGYSVGGKTGTAQIPKPEGGYFEDKYNGTYIGFVGGDMPQYVIVVRVNEPGIPGYAGSRAAAPVFVSLANMLMDNFGVTPKS